MSDVQECPDCGESFKRVATHWAQTDCENPNLMSYESMAMFSGGHDSLAMTHYCMENGLTDAVLHLDTGTGIDENFQFVEDVCEEHEWSLEVYEPRKTLREFAEEWGFPKEASHSWAYRYFKEHPLARAARDCDIDGKPKFYTGVRSDESQRRMRTVTDERQERENWIWVAPIMDWTKEDIEEYLNEHNLPRNPVSEKIHRSGECYCGAFAYRDEELLELQAHYPDHYEWLMSVEDDVQSEIGTDEDYCWWGSGGCSSDELEALMESGDHDREMVLCQDCELSMEENNE